jgi:anti-sigma B factor antagonist
MSDASRSLLQVAETEGVTVVTFLASKMLDEEEIQELGDQLFELVEKEQRRRLILDFHNVEALPSGALAKLFKLKKKLTSLHGTLKLCSIRPELFEVFRITRLDTVFEIYPDTQSAASSF